jgi:hypothetical protein
MKKAGDPALSAILATDAAFPQVSQPVLQARSPAWGRV